jgi:putative ABC transport system permease protein
MRRWLHALRELFTQEQRDADLQRELRSHLAAEAEAQIDDGADPDEARYAAKRALGHVPTIRDDTRRAWTWGRAGHVLRDLGTGCRQDLRYGLRSLVKQPAFTVAAVLALALGIGAATTIFSVIQGVLLDPYPMYRDVDRFVQMSVRDLANAGSTGRRTAFQTAELLDYTRETRAFEAVIAGGPLDVLWQSKDGTEQFYGGLTSGNTFTFLGVGAAVGRTLEAADEAPGAPPVFVISHRLWASRFGLDPSIVGTVFVLNGVPTTLVGVMPARVSKLGADAWLPHRLDPADPVTGDRFWRYQARLKPGVTIAQAEAEMNAIARRLSAKYPKNYPQRYVVHIEQVIDSIVGPFRKTLYTMAAAVALLLLIACSNVANLLLSRAAGREQEMAVRASLGASRVRLVRQLLVESLLLAIAGAAAGCLLSYVGIVALVRLIPEGLIPRESLIELNTPVLLFSLGVAAATAVVFGLAPALQTARRELVPSLRDAGKGSGAGFRRARLSSALVIGQIAIALVLLNAAGLLMRTFINMQGSDLGFNPSNLMYIRVPNGDSLRTLEAQRQFLAQALTRIRALPGVVDATSTTGTPPFGGYNVEFDVVGISRDDRGSTQIELVSDRYFSTLEMRIVKGRELTPGEILDGRRVAVVNEAMVRRHLAGHDPIGQRLSLALRQADGASPRQVFEIVGVVADARNQPLTDPIAPQAYVPASVAPARFSRGLLVRTAIEPLALTASVKHEIWAVERGVALSDVETVEGFLRRFHYAQPRLGVFIFGGFATIGLLLVVLGVASLIAYTVARQQREIGIRLAIGASRLDVLRLTFGMGVRWLVLGVAIGLGLSLLVTRVLREQLWEVGPVDPLTLVAVVVVLSVAGLTASYLPARRSTMVDPLVVLRAE